MQRRVWILQDRRVGGEISASGSFAQQFITFESQSPKFFALISPKIMAHLRDRDAPEVEKFILGAGATRTGHVITFFSANP